MKLLKFKIKGIKLFENNELSMDLYAEGNVTNEEKSDGIVFPLINNISSLNVLALTGINASGKTTALEILTFILRTYINDKPTIKEDNFIVNQGIFHLCGDREIDIESYFLEEDTLYRVESTLINNRQENRLDFKEEKIYAKIIKSNVTKKDFFKFDLEDDLRRTRSDVYKDLLLESKLLEGRSIFILEKKHDKNIRIIDSLMDTNLNISLGDYKEGVIPTEYVQYFDNSIECIEYRDKGDMTGDYIIKYRGQDQLIVPRIEIIKYLSSGTLKGLSIFNNIREVLIDGGYYIIDEIENHLNKNIIMNILDLFNSELNKKGATLIFTTHYSEILDCIYRRDSIYVLKKLKGNIEMKKFSSLLEEQYNNKNRNDYKKSEIILSGIFNTAPSYSNYNKVKKEMKGYIDGEIEYE